MNNFIFENATKTVFGEGCVREYLSCFAGHYKETVMLAYGGGSIKKNGIYDEVVESLEKAGKNVIEFAGIMPNPSYSKVQDGARLARENEVDWILGVGGGSVMDCCKAISLAAVYDGDIWTDFWARLGVISFEPLPVGVIATTAGTGSEMSGRAVITNEEEKIKTGRDYPKCNPRFALIDPAYTYTVPEKQMISGGFGILSHVMEIYFSPPDENNVSDDIAEALMRGVIRDLRTSIKNAKDYTARSNLMWESAMAENRIIKIGKRLDLQCRNMEHQLGVYTDFSHGERLAALHPVYYRHIYKDAVRKFKRFAVNVWNISADGKPDEKTARAGVEALADFIKEIGLPGTLQKLGVSRRLDLKRIADSCQISSGGYRQMTHGEIYEIFKECM